MPKLGESLVGFPGGVAATPAIGPNEGTVYYGPSDRPPQSLRSISVVTDSKGTPVNLRVYDESEGEYRNAALELED